MKILVIRGGGIGDFVVTLPVFRLLRERWPHAHIELLGQPSIAQLALKRHYLDAVRSADHGPFARFFAKGADLDRDWRNYFLSFDLVISYFFDPDDIFQSNLELCGLEPWKGGAPDTGDRLQKRWLLRGDPRIKTAPAARQLCEPLAALGLTTEDLSSTIFPSENDVAEARKRLPQGRLIALHPGSGSTSKNWSLANWLELVEKLHTYGVTPVVIGGEADGTQLDAFAKRFQNIRIVRQQDLAAVAATLKVCARYVGHDTGISHIAAAVKAKCILLFGPSDSAVWAPPALSGKVIRARPDFSDVTVDSLLSHIQTELF